MEVRSAMCPPVEVLRVVEALELSVGSGDESKCWKDTWANLPGPVRIQTIGDSCSRPGFMCKSSLNDALERNT